MRSKNTKSKIFSTVAAATIMFAAVTSSSIVSAASASFSASGGGTVTVGSTVKVTISVNGSGGEYNAVSATATYNNLSYVSASPNSAWSPVPGLSTSGNSVTFAGAMLGSKATGIRQIFTVTLKAPNTPGTATVNVAGTLAFINGGGTVNGGGNSITFTVKEAPKAAAGSVQVSSTTHQDPNVWYQTKEINLSWTKPGDVNDFSYILDQSASTNPDNTSEGAGTSKSFKTNEVKEGTNYFHIKAKNDIGWGTTTHFTINIDTTAPDIFTVTKVKNDDKGNYSLFFSTNDGGSGISKYTLKIGTQDLGEQRSGYVSNNDPEGAIVIAYDKAGNVREGKLATATNTTSTNVTPTSNDSKSPTLNSAVNGKLEGESQGVLQKGGPIFLISGLVLLVYGIAMTFLYLKQKNGSNLKGYSTVNVGERSGS